MKVVSLSFNTGPRTFSFRMEGGESRGRPVVPSSYVVRDDSGELIGRLQVPPQPLHDAPLSRRWSFSGGRHEVSAQAAFSRKVKILKGPDGKQIGSVKPADIGSDGRVNHWGRKDAVKGWEIQAPGGTAATVRPVRGDLYEVCGPDGSVVATVAAGVEASPIQYRHHQAEEPLPLFRTFDVTVADGVEELPAVDGYPVLAAVAILTVEEELDRFPAKAVLRAVPDGTVEAAPTRRTRGSVGMEIF